MVRGTQVASSNIEALYYTLEKLTLGPKSAPQMPPSWCPSAYVAKLVTFLSRGFWVVAYVGCVCARALTNTHTLSGMRKHTLDICNDIVLLHIFTKN